MHLKLICIMCFCPFHFWQLGSLPSWSWLYAPLFSLSFCSIHLSNLKVVTNIFQCPTWHFFTLNVGVWNNIGLNEWFEIMSSIPRLNESLLIYVEQMTLIIGNMAKIIQTHWVRNLGYNQEKLQCSSWCYDCVHILHSQKVVS